MSFMNMYVYSKGATYCADCSKCGRSIYSHEWTTYNNNELRDALEAGTARCFDCGGTTDPETFFDCGRMYAGRYSANGYMDCTDWHYSRNLRALKRELRDLYGDSDD